MRTSSSSLALVLCVSAASVLGSSEAALAQGSAKAAGQPQVTFSKDVAPILQRSCQNCHRPGSIAPMSLLTYDEARPWAKAMKQKTSLREMPPWGLDRNVGYDKFKNDPTLTDAEITMIAKWADSNAPQGNPADMPPARQFDDSANWHIKPDIIVSMEQTHTIKATGADEVVNFETDPHWTEDRYFKAVETKPNVESAKAVHHSNTNIVEDPEHDSEAYFLNEYSIGKNADIYPEDTGRLLKAGSQIHFGVHYFSIGEEVQSRSSVGFVLYPKGVVPKHVLTTQHVGDNNDIDIPANTIGRHDGYLRLSKPVQMAAIQPHMHSRGKRMCVEAIYPDVADTTRPGPAKTEMLNCVNYDFSWNLSYTYDESAAPLLPAGTVLHVTAWHDNTAANKYVPDPRNWVGFGSRSVDVMSFLWVNFYYLDEQEYQQKLAARKAKTSN